MRLQALLSVKSKINIEEFYPKKEEFYWYDLGIKQNTVSFLHYSILRGI